MSWLSRNEVKLRFGGLSIEALRAGIREIEVERARVFADTVAATDPDEIARLEARRQELRIEQRGLRDMLVEKERAYWESIAPPDRPPPTEIRPKGIRSGLKFGVVGGGKT